jgi:UDPglucose 6-dehydrogenase
MKTIGVIGYGFVGKATAELKTVSKINIYDPIYQEYNSDNNLKSAYESDFVICCVPTPQSDDGRINLTILEESLENWVSYGKKGIFTIKSTIPCGTVEYYNTKYNTDKIIHNPEFLTERTYIEDFLNPTDVVIGGKLEHCNLLKEVYENFYEGKNIDINICSDKEAELLKTVRNSFYATKVIFMNEIYEFCNKMNIDYSVYEKILTNNGKHSWWGPQHTQVPGHDGKIGYGGKCFPKDVSGLYNLAKDNGVELSVLKAANDKNCIIRK